MAWAAIGDSYPAVTGASGADFAFSADSCLEQAEAPTNMASAKNGIPAGRAKRLIRFPLSSRLLKTSPSSSPSSPEAGGRHDHSCHRSREARLLNLGTPCSAPRAILLRVRERRAAGGEATPTRRGCAYFVNASAPAFATCASCSEVAPDTPTAPMILPSTTSGIPPSSGLAPLSFSSRRFGPP